jgi:hypothetical protein
MQGGLIKVVRMELASLGHLHGAVKVVGVILVVEVA